MDQHKFVAIVRQFPQIWERSHPKFRDKDAKDCAWEVIGSKMRCTGDICREVFKSIREKYIREREKSAQYGKNYREWELLSELTFLDPNIVPRKQSTNSDEDMQKAEEFCSQINFDTAFESVSQTNFDKALIELVRKTTPIWDRNSNTYPNKQLKNQLWQNIASKLKKEVNSCMLRWKALREKYIRQKTKYQQEGDIKWELLDEMNFLDKVIQYRKKQTDNDNQRRMTYNENAKSLTTKQNEFFQDSNSSFSQSVYNCEPEEDVLTNDSSNDCHIIVKQENTVLQKSVVSSCNVNCNGVSRKRSLSASSETSAEKISKSEDSEGKEKTPEQLFGELVAVMLSKKPEKYRNLYMIEIMQSSSWSNTALRLKTLNMKKKIQDYFKTNYNN